VTRDQVVAVTMLKWVRRMVDSYHGPREFDAFQQFMREALDEKNFKADQILADAAAEIL